MSKMNAPSNKKRLKKYGLVWDTSNEENVDNDAEMPLITENTDMKLGDSGDNILIEGDNYHSLSVLNFTHRKKIDVIYIDPPYNTGNQFRYNDHLVNEKDAYRHSKWISFMEKRLVLARRLLKPTGVVFISIDDNELAQLKLLCDEIFGGGNLLGIFSRIAKRGGSKGRFISPAIDYVLAYAYNIERTKNFKAVLTERYIDTYKLRDKDGRLYKEKGLYQSSLDVRPNQNYPIKCPDDSTAQPPKGKVFRWVRETFDKNLKAGNVIFKKTKGSPLLDANGKKSEYNIYTKQFLEDIKKKGYVPNNLIEDALNIDGTSELKKMNVDFQYPKPTGLISNLIMTAFHHDKSITVLDFFAGSGTTGHAVLKLNKEDNGSRRFILCTNNENDICTKVCHPRIKKAIKGYKECKNGRHVDGLGGDMRYFGISLVDSVSTDYNKKQIMGCITSMLCMRDGCFNAISKGSHHALFSNSSGRKQMGVIYDARGTDALKTAVQKQGTRTSVYVFSLDGGVGEYEFSSMDKLVDLKPTPQDILDMYKTVCARRRRRR